MSLYSKFADLSLRNRILAGFVPVVSVVFVLSILMATSYSTINDDFETLERNSQDALRATDFSNHWDDLQRSILLYGLVGYRGVLAKIRQQQGVLTALLADPAWELAPAGSPEAVQLHRLREYYAAVSKDFDEIVSDSDRIHALRSEYENEAIPRLERLIVLISSDAAGNGSSEVLIARDRALALVERISVNSQLYLEAPDTGTARLVLDSAEELKGRLRALANTHGEAMDDGLENVIEAATDVKRRFSEIVTLKRNQTYLLNVVMAGRNAEINRTSAELKAFYLDALDQGRRAIQTTIQHSQSQLWFVFIVVFALAVISSVFISGSLARPVNAIARTLSDLAKGEFHRDIPGRARSDEVGAMAAAAQAFKTMAQTLDRQSNQLAESNTELERFVYVASHDLQEPLRKIQSFINILEKNLESGDEDKTRDVMRRILGATTRMRQLVEDLLTFSRTKRSDTPFGEVALNDVVDQVIEDMVVTIRETNTRIEVHALPTVIGGRVQLCQMFQNLISNAIKYRRKDVPAEVSVTAGYVDCHCPDDASHHVNHVVVSVTDNGIGFDEAYFSRILEPFQRLHGRSEYPGSGIGLAIVDNIVKQHGGKLSATSAQNKGSTFSVEIPGKEIAGEVNMGELHAA